MKNTKLAVYVAGWLSAGVLLGITYAQQPEREATALSLGWHSLGSLVSGRHHQYLRVERAGNACVYVVATPFKSPSIAVLPVSQVGGRCR